MRSLTGDGLRLVTRRRTKEDGIFEGDPVTVLHGIGDDKARILRQDGVTKIKDMAFCLTKTSRLSLRGTD